MSGAGGKWMTSSVMEEHIERLRNAGYLSGDIAHRLPDEGQLKIGGASCRERV